MYEYGYIKNKRVERTSRVSNIVAWIITIAVVAYALGVLVSIKTPEASKAVELSNLDYCASAPCDMEPAYPTDA